MDSTVTPRRPAAPGEDEHVCCAHVLRHPCCRPGHGRWLLAAGQRHTAADDGEDTGAAVVGLAERSRR